MIICDFYTNGRCAEPENNRMFKSSGCYECNHGKQSGESRIDLPICVLLCAEFCDEETCNIGEYSGIPFER